MQCTRIIPFVLGKTVFQKTGPWCQKKLGTTALRHTRERSLSSFLSFSPRTPHTKEMPCEDFVRKQPSIMPAWKRTDAARVSSGTPNLWNMRKQMSVIEVTQLAFLWQPEQTGGSQVALLLKNPAANAGGTRDVGWTPGWGRCPGEGSSNPLQYSCLGNPRDRGAWGAAVQGVAQSRTLLSHWTTTKTLSPGRLYSEQWGPGL